MNAIVGTVKNGRVEVEAPVDWPEGSPVRVELGLNGHAQDDDDRPETPEEIEAKIRRLEAIEPWMTLEEEAAWQADRKAYREWETATRPGYDKRIEELFP